ncbi:MAG: hypothetical protein ACI4L9_04450 [Candidatus Coproplasma sp.]
MKKIALRLLAILLALTPLTLVLACGEGENTANTTPPETIDAPTEPTPPEEQTPEETPSEEAPSEGNSLPGGLVDMGDFKSDH